MRMCMWGWGGVPYVQLGIWQGEECMQGEVLYCMCVTERDGFKIQITFLSDSQGFSSVSAPSVFCCMNWRKANGFPVTTLRDTAWECDCVCVCAYYSYMYIPPGTCGRRAALWLTWARPPACGWIPTGPCTSPRHGRVTSEHTPAGWPQWVAMTPAMPTSESGLRYSPYVTPSYLAVCIFFFFLLLFTSDRDMMDGCFPHCCGLSLLSSLIHQTL